MLLPLVLLRILATFRASGQRTTTLPSRPAALNGQPASRNELVSNIDAVLQNGTAVMSQASSRSHRVSNGHVTPQSQLTSTQPASATDLITASPRDTPIRGSGPLQYLFTNDDPPERKPHYIHLPPAPTVIERTKTDAFTPPSDPSEVKQVC